MKQIACGNIEVNLQLKVIDYRSISHLLTRISKSILSVTRFFSLLTFNYTTVDVFFAIAIAICTLYSNRTACTLQTLPIKSTLKSKMKSNGEFKIEEKNEQFAAAAVYYRQSTTFSPKWLMEYNVKHDREQNYSHLQCLSIFNAFVFFAVSTKYVAWRMKREIRFCSLCALGLHTCRCFYF